MKTKRDVLKEFKVYNEIVHDTPLLELIEDAMEYYAKQKLNLPGIGSKRPSRSFCRICNQIQKMHFWVPDEIWEEAIPVQFHKSQVCFDCFTARADEKLLQWDKDFKIVMVTSSVSQSEIIKAACASEKGGEANTSEGVCDCQSFETGHVSDACPIHG